MQLSLILDMCKFSHFHKIPDESELDFVVGNACTIFVKSSMAVCNMGTWRFYLLVLVYRLSYQLLKRIVQLLYSLRQHSI